MLPTLVFAFAKISVTVTGERERERESYQLIRSNLTCTCYLRTWPLCKTNMKGSTA